MKQGLWAAIALLASVGLARAEFPAPGTVLAEITVDVTGDGTPDTARLVVGTDADAVLVLDTGQRRVTAPKIAWLGGPAPGPSLEATSAGSLQVVTGNDSIGRERWSQTLTLAWRDDDLLLAGFTYGWRDTLDAANTGRCDVNLLTGRGVLTVNGQETAITQPPDRLPVTLWDGQPPRSCGLD
ncbi:hypothetical protein Dshi_3298 [Dinoroseobacter shibae DFL 12 = DSM 16493]|jgi:hypothetical protein|uniref:Uncharacterized protein n=3 Tax=Pseudomonadota TaxID=1224 RepID=A8LMV6_DINSH|nr:MULTISPECIES: hypothetical protein [Dinoroseobacter]ABV95031.1 hypothetical protein Dshi_3298 [Dinoroseobacter shibae DFL 12 = DSM 16493]MDD9717848.1 hypothetical protein [Dinoroseobacter sp. PD6]URF50753.1 hypothetical protein M8007_16955 [Dinoroseobacter shibae]